MISSPSPRPYTVREELANALTHGAGAVLALVALVVLVVLAGRAGDPWQLVGSAVFGASLLLLYTTSTLYHAIPHPRWKPTLRALDHSSIYLLIAGTYTPFTLVNLRGPWGWSLFGVVWGAALVGILVRTLKRRKSNGLAAAIYVAMGWVVVVAVVPLVERVAPAGLALLVAGGLCYTGGVVFYLWRRLPYHHAIWHGFVLAGSACHVLAVMFYATVPTSPFGN